MRHGQTLFNVRKKIQGSCDSPLTELGIQQAEIASTYFNAIDLDHAYSSTAERSSDTLEIMDQDDHHNVLAVSHAGACVHFLSAWHDPQQVLQEGITNCCIFKYEYDVTEKNFTLLEVIRHGI